MNSEILNILAESGVISKYKIDGILQLVAERKTTIEQALLDSGVTKEEIMEAKSKHYGFPIKKVGEEQIATNLLNLIPEDTARLYQMAPIERKKGVLHVGMVNPTDIEARNALQFISSKEDLKIEIAVISQEDFERILNMYHGLTGEVGEALQELSVINLEDIESTLEKSLFESGKEKIVEDAPVTKMVAVILKHAVEERASDVHIENVGENTRVRFRVDGLLKISLVLPKNVHEAIVARVKILSRLRLDEKRKPQDGRFYVVVNDRKIDFRVSVMPMFYGEKVAIRILDPEIGVKTLDVIGMTEEQIETVRRSLKKPYGLVLITGPTGCGKTTTLYSMLQELDKETKNVMSLEDPIEYEIKGVNQSQVRPEIGYTFATGLRSMVRQDPDVILVGEIRDRETAQLAIQAALTGHMVLSTLHTNNAIGIVPRLIDMGVDPYLIAPTLELAIAQRLIRRICDGAEEEVIGASIRALIDRQFADLPGEFKSKLDITRPVYNAKPTKDCPGGVRGRIAAFEMFRVDNQMENLILNRPTEQAMYKEARSKGMLTMRENAILRSMEKKVPFSEASAL